MFMACLDYLQVLWATMMITLFCLVGASLTLGFASQQEFTELRMPEVAVQKVLSGYCSPTGLVL